MKLPSEIKRVSLHKGDRTHSLYPPMGFHQFFENELGNGDCFGLYWPLGRESIEPIVAEIWHDEWRLMPTYSNLSSFLKATKSLDDDGNYPDPPTLEDDPNSPRACFDAARLKLKTQEVNAAIDLLELSVSILPEYTDALTALFSQYLRVGRVNDAAVTAIRAIISPPSFGERPVKALRWLCSLNEPTASIVGDPIWLARNDLKLSYGGAKENSDYPILLSAIEKYLEQSKILQAISLMQTYAEQMHKETVSFQERYEFNAREFYDRQLELSAQLTDGPRQIQF